MTVEEIARGLSEAEREELCGRATSWSGWISYSGIWRPMVEQGLAEIGTALYLNGQSGFASRLTPLGLSVRQYLEQQP